MLKSNRFSGLQSRRVGLSGNRSSSQSVAAKLGYGVAKSTAPAAASDEASVKAKNPSAVEAAKAFRSKALLAPRNKQPATKTSLPLSLPTAEANQPSSQLTADSSRPASQSSLPPAAEANGADGECSTFEDAFLSAVQASQSLSSDQLCSKYLHRSSSASAADEGMKKKQQTKAPKLQKSQKPRKAAAKAPTEEELPTFDFDTGTWVECCQCRQWRFLEEVKEPCQVPEEWFCWYAKDERQNSCDKPELSEFFYANSSNFALSNKYVAGSLVWARLQGHPYWPAIVEVDADYGSFFELEAETNDVASYHVVFLGEPVSRAWVSHRQLRPFNGVADMDGMEFRVKTRDFRSSILKLAEQAAGVAELSFEQRLERLGFAKRYGGKIGREPSAPVKEQSSATKKQPGRKPNQRDEQQDEEEKKKAEKKTKKKTKKAKKEEEEQEEEEEDEDETPVGPVITAEELETKRRQFRRRVADLCAARGVKCPVAGSDSVAEA